MKSKVRFTILRYATYACGILALLLSLFAGFFRFETGTHYFLRGAFLPILAAVFASLGIVCAIIAGFLNPDREEPAPCRYAYLIPGVGFLAATFVPCFLGKSPLEIALRLALVAAALLFLSAVSCALSFLLKDPKHQGLLAIFGFFPVLAPAALAFFFYFDRSVEMNSPLKVALQTGLLFAMFLFLLDLRRILGKPLPRLLDGLRLAFFPAASLGVGMILSTFLSGGFRRGDYLLGALLLLSLQVTLLIGLFPHHGKGNK